MNVQSVSYTDPGYQAFMQMTQENSTPGFWMSTWDQGVTTVVKHVWVNDHDLEGVGK